MKLTSFLLFTSPQVTLSLRSGNFFFDWLHPLSLVIITGLHHPALSLCHFDTAQHNSIVHRRWSSIGQHNSIALRHWSTQLLHWSVVNSSSLLQWTLVTTFAAQQATPHWPTIQTSNFDLKNFNQDSSLFCIIICFCIPITL